MSIFKTAEPKEEKVLPWIPLNNLSQIKSILIKSNTKPQIIFKHSGRCGVSRMVINQFIDSYTYSENEFDLYYLDILNFKQLSNEIGYTLQVFHQSPQLIIIKNGMAKAYSSHSAINSIELEKFL